jgi:hypothetical protein
VTFDGLKRIQKKTGFRRAQAFQPLEFYTQVEEKVDREAVRALTDEIMNMSSRLALLMIGFLSKNKHWKKSLAESGLQPPRQAK